MYVCMLKQVIIFFYSNIVSYLYIYVNKVVLNSRPLQVKFYMERLKINDMA